MRALAAAWMGVVALSWAAGGVKAAVTWGILSPFIWLGLWMLYSFVSAAKGLGQALMIGFGFGVIGVLAIGLESGIAPEGAATLLTVPSVAAALLWAVNSYFSRRMITTGRD